MLSSPKILSNDKQPSLFCRSITGKEKKVLLPWRHQYLFKKFNVENPKEMKASTLLLAEALKEPLEDFEE